MLCAARVRDDRYRLREARLGAASILAQPAERKSLGHMRCNRRLIAQSLGMRKHSDVRRDGMALIRRPPPLPPRRA